jgi:ribonuclease P protein component
VYREGKRQLSRNLSVFYLLPQVNDDACVRVGITVGRAIGGAVARNRVKRRMREAVRKNLSLLTGAVDVVINPRKSVAEMEFTELEKEVAAMFAKIERAPRGLVQISGSKR